MTRVFTEMKPKFMSKMTCTGEMAVKENQYGEAKTHVEVHSTLTNGDFSCDMNFSLKKAPKECPETKYCKFSLKTCQ